MEFFHQPQLPIIFVHFTFTFIFAFISYHELPWLRGVLFAADFHFHIRCSVYNHFHFHWHCQFTGAVLPRPRCDLLRAGGRGGRRCQRPARLLWDPGVRQQGLLRLQGHCREKNMKIFTVVKFELENKMVDSTANLTFIGRRRRVRWRELGSERCNTTASASGGGGGGGGASPISWSTLASCNHWRQEMEDNDDHVLVIFIVDRDECGMGSHCHRLVHHLTSAMTWPACSVPLWQSSLFLVWPFATVIISPKWWWLPFWWSFGQHLLCLICDTSSLGK